MAFIKEESEDIRITEVFSIKHEDTEEQTGVSFSKLNSVIWFLFTVQLYRNESYLWRMTYDFPNYEIKKNTRFIFSIFYLLVFFKKKLFMCTALG